MYASRFVLPSPKLQQQSLMCRLDWAEKGWGSTGRPGTRLHFTRYSTPRGYGDSIPSSTALCPVSDVDGEKTAAAWGSEKYSSHGGCRCLPLVLGVLRTSRRPHRP